MTLEATLQATGFENERLDFIKPVDPTEDVVSSSLSADERAWAAQHVNAWRQCETSNMPLLIFQDDTAFSSESNVLESTKSLVAAVENPGSLVMYLGASIGDDTPMHDAQLMDEGLAIDFTLTAVSSACVTNAYVLWPKAAAKLLASLPLDAPVPTFLAQHVGKAVAVSPALAISEEAYEAHAVAQRSLVK
eukprot:CAMPEP_0115834836 /NCGR_PEP_ID=MMETSP0287-20121206/3887_1 /TAXON_ID=412157 /ORGANISM="Chrysochromulina rotalis, Strain UIO044" /LENGTH=190 /DNA_ID=CAMNT_0003288281 /DNA_START=39 /DNA_END=611 /DNA_ORIENTATION=-